MKTNLEEWEKIALEMNFSRENKKIVQNNNFSTTRENLYKKIMGNYKKYIWKLHHTMVKNKEGKLIAKLDSSFMNTGSLSDIYKITNTTIYNVFIQFIYVDYDIKNYPYLNINIKQFYYEYYLVSQYYIDFIEYWKKRGDNYVNQLKTLASNFINEIEERYEMAYNNN